MRSDGVLDRGWEMKLGEITTVISRGESLGHIGATRWGMGLYTAPSSRESGRARKGGIAPVFAGRVTIVPVASVTEVVAGVFLFMNWFMTSCIPQKMARPCKADFKMGYKEYQRQARKRSCR